MRPYLFFLFIASPSYAWETSRCMGAKEERIALLSKFGMAAQQFVLEVGAIPDLCNVSVPELERKIPDGLKEYLVCGSSEYDEVYYSCWLEYSDERQVEEKCMFSISSGRISCGGITATYDN